MYEKYMNHKHLLITAHTDLPLNVITDVDLKQHLIDLTKKIEMKSITSPMVKYSSSEGNTGYMGIIGISTSHISFHHWDRSIPQVLQFDIFSCKSFDYDITKHVIKEFWQCEFCSIISIQRYPETIVEKLL